MWAAVSDVLLHESSTVCYMSSPREHSDYVAGDCLTIFNTDSLQLPTEDKWSCFWRPGTWCLTATSRCATCQDSRPGISRSVAADFSASPCSPQSEMRVRQHYLDYHLSLVWGKTVLSCWISVARVAVSHLPIAKRRMLPCDYSCDECGVGKWSRVQQPRLHPSVSCVPAILQLVSLATRQVGL